MSDNANRYLQPEVNENANTTTVMFYLILTNNFRMNGCTFALILSRVLKPGADEQNAAQIKTGIHKAGYR